MCSTYCVCMFLCLLYAPSHQKKFQVGVNLLGNKSHSDSDSDSGCEVWGPATKGDFSNWDKHPTEALHAEFCKSILRVQRKTPNNACRAELGQYPLIIDIQKRAVKFW